MLMKMAQDQALQGCQHDHLRVEHVDDAGQGQRYALASVARFGGRVLNAQAADANRLARR